MAVDDLFRQALSESFNSLREQLRTTIDQFGGTAPLEQRVGAASQLHRACATYRSILPKASHTGWLNAIHDATLAFITTKDVLHAVELQRVLVAHGNQVAPIEPKQTNAYAFDRFFEELHGSQELPQKFDDLAAAIQKLIDSGEVETVHALKTLEAMVEALKANRKGTFWAVVWTIKFAKKGWELAKSGLAPAVLASQLVANIATTLDDTEARSVKIQEQMLEKVSEALAEIAPRNRRLLAEEAGHGKTIELPAPSEPAGHTESLE